MRKIYLVLACFNLFQLAFGQSDVEFRFGGNYKECKVNDVVIDKDDNFITTGVYWSNIRKDSLGGLGINYENRNLIGKTLYNSGGFLAKFNQKKEIQWLITIENASSANHHLLVDDSSNVYLIGKFYQKINFDFKNTLNSSTGDIFVAKYTSEGKFKWAKKYLGSSDNGAFKPKLDSQGNLHIIGKYQNSLEVEGKEVLKATGQNPEPYILKLDRNGNYIWAKSFNENLDLNAISVNNKSEVFIIGDFKGSLTINGNILESEGMQDIFYAKYDKNGQFLWVKTIAGKVEDSSHNIETDKLGNVYLAGIMSDNAKFDMLNVNIKTSNGKSIFVGKINDSNGKINWIRNISYPKDMDASLFTTVQLLKLNADGEPYIFGVMAISLSIDSQEIIKVNGLFRYIVKFDTKGTLVSATPKVDNSTSASTYITSMTIDSKRNVYVSGYTSYIRIGDTYGFLKTNIELYENSCGNKNVSIIRNYNLSGNLTLSDAILNNQNFNYQWYRNGEYISNANNATFQATEPGYYSLKLINKTNSACEVSSSNSIPVFPQVLSTPSVLNYDSYNETLYTTSPNADKIEWYHNGILIKETTSTVMYYPQNGIYKTKEYFANNTIIKESNEVNIERGGLEANIKKDVYYDDGDRCKPVPYLRLVLSSGAPLWEATAGVQIKWFLNGELIKDSTKNHFKAIKPGEYQVSIAIDNPNWRSTSGKYKIVAEDFPKSLSITKIEDICGAKALLKVDDSFMQRYTFQSILWRVDDKVIPEATQPFYNANKGGFYTFSVQYKENTIGKTCTYNSFINFEKKNDFKLNLGYSYAGSGCVVDSFKVFTEQNPRYTYTWTKNDVPIEKQTTNEIFIKDKARYKGIVRRDDGCVNETDEISLKGCTSDAEEKFLLLNPPKITADKTSFFTNEKALLSFEGCSNVNLQWLKNDQLIVGANQKVLEVKDGGNYALQIEKLGCKASTNTLKIIVETILAVGEENPNFTIEVYPNPTEEKVFVSIPAQINTLIDVKMTDISGKLISNYNFSTLNSQFIDLKAFRAGVYLLVFEMQGKRIVKKIIKNN